MFRGDNPELQRVWQEAFAVARDLGQRRVGSEHLLLSLTAVDGVVSEILRGHHVTVSGVRHAARAAAPLGAGAAADRALLAMLDQRLDHLPDAAGPAALDRLVVRDPVFPLGARRARQRCARLSPPIGLDAQASYQASLRLALARRELQHRSEHLALTLLSLDPGVDWVLNYAHVDRRALLTTLAHTFPPPRGHFVQRLERELGRRARSRYLVRHYQRVTGRTVIDASAPVALISCS
jgi:hypothetical protein